MRPGADLLDLPVASALAWLALDLSGGAAVAAALEDNVARSAGAGPAAAVARGAVAAIAGLILLDESGAGSRVLAALAHGHFDGCWGGWLTWKRLKVLVVVRMRREEK